MNKSPGPDRLHPRILNELSGELKEPLILLFKQSLEEGAVPKAWKEGKIAPIFKKGKENICDNYRPVSLTSIVWKVMEKMIRAQAINHLNQFISSCQHGFIEGRSCITQLLDTIDTWSRLLDKGSAIDAIYRDFSKAFDSLPHRRLLLKLEAYEIKGALLRWLESFLTGRRQIVPVNGNLFNWASVDSGVPQGSVLRPLLFICYINDMPGVVLSTFRMFADDTKIFRQVDSEEDTENLQSDLTKLKDWAGTWQLRFNATKCKVMHLGWNNHCQEYTMEQNDYQVLLSVTECEKDLGVHVDKDVEIVSNKANRLCGMIRRSFSSMNGDMFNSLFRSLIRPHLEYGNTV